jgi:dipeptidase D
MAILSDPAIKTGRIECLFTVDEETGMTGAINLQPDFFTGRILLNLDSEDEGILFIGCAGGMDTVCSMNINLCDVREGQSALEISLKGLHGGHSGDEIHKGYGNSIKLMTRLLAELTGKWGISLIEFNGGNLRNAIPREAYASITAETGSLSSIEHYIESYYHNLKEQFADLEKELKISFRGIPLPSKTMDRESQDKLLTALECCPHGVIAWSEDMPDLVETSTNLASIKFIGNNMVSIVTTQRSSVEESKHEAAAMVAACMAKAGATVMHSDGYPGWKPDTTSQILSITRRSYSKLFAKEPQVKAIHAGLECGMFYEKIKGIDMISFGPTIRGAHTPEEMIETATVRMFWDLLLEVLVNIPVQPPVINRTL